jgi:hypothetical protein
VTDRIGVDVLEISRDLETWLPVVGYEGYYEVSDHGRVRSLDRTVLTCKGYLRRMTGQQMAPFWNSHRRARQVKLTKAGKPVTRQLHQVEAFVGPRPDGTEGCHWNGDPSDNRLTNLRWDTHTANMQDLIRHGTHYFSQRERCKRGHLLVAPNLLPRAKARSGGRDCLTCGRARVRQWKADHFGRAFDYDEFLDRKYAEVMGERDPLVAAKARASV